MPLAVAKILATAHHSLKSKAAQPRNEIVVLTKGLVVIKVQTVQANCRNPLIIVFHLAPTIFKTNQHQIRI